MAPSMTRTPRYTPRRRRRSAGDLLVGLLAIAALVALTVGVPFALVTVFGLPVPHAHALAGPAHPPARPCPRS